jgi:lysine 2,3-aminomutase
MPQIQTDSIPTDPLELDQDEEPPSTKNYGITMSSEDMALGIGAASVSIVPVVSRKPPDVPLSKRRVFRRRFFPKVLDKQWNNWQWQIQNRICSLSHLSQFLNLSEEELGAFNRLNTKLPLAITPYYMSLLSENDTHHPLRRSVVPTVHELFRMPGEENDPLGEEVQSPIPGLVHRYPDRVLLLVIDFCATYCRYCTRARVVGHGAIQPSGSRLEKAVAYIRSNPQIRDVLLSGGDPLTLSDKRLDRLLSQIRDIPHVEVIRIGTKVPAVLPQRITPQLVKMLRKYHPLWMSLHFTHPEECTVESYKACKLLADAGIPLGSQTVLLKDINDDIDTMQTLMHEMMKMRVRPYYLYQCDPISGTGHLRTSVEKGLEIIRGLRGHTSGYAVPNYVIDAPGGGGKIPLMPNYVVNNEGGDLLLCNYENKLFHYPDTADHGCSS